LKKTADLFVSQMTVPLRSTNQLPRWPYKTTTFIRTFYSSDDSWKVLDENFESSTAFFKATQLKEKN